VLSHEARRPVDHRVDLLAGPGSERVRAAITDFVARALDQG
jgi:hypothetical protein